MSNLKLSKNWILGDRSLEFEGTYTLKPGAMSDLIDGAMRTLNAMIYDESTPHELRDFKGRNPHDTLLPGIATPRTDELFRVGGMVAVEEAGPEFSWEPFEVVCYSPFTRFEGTHHIVHTTQVERTGALPSWLPTRLIGCAAPIKPRFFRYGLEHFSSILTFASLGYAPQVRESVLLDCVGDTVALRVTTEYKRGKEPNPFAWIPAYTTLSDIIERATGSSPQEELRRELAATL
jgi:hypothetical protein